MYFSAVWRGEWRGLQEDWNIGYALFQGSIFLPFYHSSIPFLHCQFTRHHEDHGEAGPQTPARNRRAIHRPGTSGGHPRHNDTGQNANNDSHTATLPEIMPAMPAFALCELTIINAQLQKNKIDFNFDLISGFL